MGTYYELVKEKDFTHNSNFGIDEMSNKLALVFSNESNESKEHLWKATEKMTPKELAKVFLKGLTVCSYWMDTDDLKLMIIQHLDDEIY